MAQFTFHADGVATDTVEGVYVGEGAQVTVWRIGDKVIKIPKSREETLATVESWGLPETAGVDSVVEDLKKQVSFIERRQFKYLPSDLVGYLERVTGVEVAYSTGASLDENTERYATNVFIQPFAPEINICLENASMAYAEQLFQDYVYLLERQMYYKLVETTLKIGTNYGRLPTGELIIIDAFELTSGLAEVHEMIKEKRWRHVMNGRDAPYLPAQFLDMYYTTLDTHITEDVLLALWTQDHAECFNQTWRNPEKPEKFVKRGRDTPREFFHSSEWQQYCDGAVQDIHHPKAFVMELTESMDPQSFFCETSSSDDDTKYPGMIAYYRQVEDNPLLADISDNNWYWELQFVRQEVLDALLEERETLVDDYGFSLMLRHDDYAGYYAEFSQVIGSRVNRNLRLNVHDGVRMDNSHYPGLDENIKKAMSESGIARYRIVDGYPFLPVS